MWNNHTHAPMPISKQIQDLTALALKDRVLTFMERQVIIESATKEGVSEAEINAYLDDALAERLQSYLKEDLTRCPHCGAQIPLIADQCPFCGESLQKGESSPTPPPYINGAEADIISQENVRTAVEQHNIKTCPDCGAPFPLVSNVCTHCGHVLHEQKDSDLNVKNLIENIQQSIDEIKSTPQPTFGQVLWHRRKLLFFFIAAILLAAAIKGFFAGFQNELQTDTYNTLATMATILSAGLWIAAAVTNNDSKLTSFKRDNVKASGKKSPIGLADDRFYTAIHREEKYAAQIHTLYGDHAEAKRLLDELSTLTTALKKDREQNRKKLAISMLGFAVGLILTLFFPTGNSNKKQLEIYFDYQEFVNTEIPITINEQQPVSDENAPYISVSGDAKLSFDIRPEANGNILIALRVSGILIKSTGNPIDEDHLCRLRLMLLDSDGVKAGEQFGEIYARESYYLYGMLQKGEGGSYLDFVSDDADFGDVQDIANQMRSGSYSYYIY